MLLQPSLNQYVFNTLIKCSKLNHMCLPEQECSFGEVYFVHHQTVRVVVVHSNFIVGINEKKERFIRKGLWWENFH